MTAGHIGESNAAFKAEKSNSYALGKFEIVGFSHVLRTSETGCSFPTPRRSHFLLYASGDVFITLFTRQGLSLFFFFPFVFCLVTV